MWAKRMCNRPGVYTITAGKGGQRPGFSVTGAIWVQSTISHYQAV